MTDRAPSSDAPHPDGRYSIALITVEETAFPEIRRSLGPAFHTVLATTEDEIKALIDDPNLRAILFDLDAIGVGASDGIDVLKEMRNLREDLVFVAMTRSNDRAIPIKASRAGADEFFLAPLNFSELQIVLARAIQKRAMEIEGRRMVEQVENKSAFCGLVGGSAAMQKVYQAVLSVADSNSSVVLRGESGTGKELVAQAIVQTGSRADKPYVCLNCSALPEGLIESELFGYEKGAFTGADATRPGLIESAQGGTLFLDEITTLNQGLQSKLLRVLQEHTVQRLGGRTAKKIDFRLITATNEDLEDLVKKGRFREDLYYRINVVPITIPPLRERAGDITVLVDHFLRVYCASAKKPLKRLQPDVVEILEDYPWPGNVRELENIVQRLVVMGDSAVITAEQLPQTLLVSSTASQEAILIPENGVDFDAEMQRIEVAYLSAALRRTGGKKSAAAALLRIDGQRMKYLCRKLKL
ncbi:MAG TPA: sigma-54 dependent transcriptional regulator [Candidatus Acidoferrum sp.]|nr:sigma-54 dependent transcriptional regulator [Candidatus Acidoferrum sp.]